jgi:hypothetical protein
LWRDIRSLVSQRGSHQLIALALAVAIPIGIATVFILDTKDAHRVPPPIIYVESWPLNRSIEESRANIEAYEKRRKEYEEERRRSFQKVDDSLNKLGI